MTFLNILCRVCAGFVHSFVQGLFACKSPIFRASRYFVHGVTVPRVRMRAGACVYAHTRTHARIRVCTNRAHSAHFPIFL